LRENKKGKRLKTILHLCADIGSDSYVWRQNGYEVILVGKEIGVENVDCKYWNEVINEIKRL